MCAFAISSRDGAGDLESIVRSARAIVWEAYAPEVRFTYVSDYAEELLGHPVANWYDPGFWESLIHPEDRAAALAFCAQQTARHRDHDFDYRIRTADGRYLWLRDTVTVVLSEGEATRLRGVMTDITEVKALEAELRQAKRAAEAADAAKAAFLAEMGHELRTPLNTVLGLAQVGARSEEAEQMRRLFGRIDDAGRRLLGLIDDVLEFSRGGEDALAPVAEPFDPARLLAEAAEEAEAAAAAKGLALAVEIAPGLPAELCGDPRRIRQILANLLSNAVRYTCEGTVTLVARMEGEALAVTVSDTGIGMGQEAAARAFEPFWRHPDAVEAERQGLGLGLSIVSSLVRRMGGEIALDSAPGQGTRARLRLPLGPPLARPAPCRRALCVEDDPAHGEVVRKLLGLCGVAAEVVETGEAALDAAEGADLVLLDLRLPGIDGFETARRLRAAERAANRAPARLVGVSAGAGAGRAVACRAAGMDAFLEKPLRVEALARLIHDLFPAPR